MFLQGKEVGQGLGGMVIIGEAVPYRHAGFGGELFHCALGKSPEFDGIKHASKDPCGVGDGFFFFYLAPGGAQVGGKGSLVPGCHFEGAAGAGGIFFKNEGKILAFQGFDFFSGFLVLFQLFGKIQIIGKFFRCIVGHGEKGVVQ